MPCMANTGKTGNEFLALCANLIDQACQAAGMAKRTAAETALRVMKDAQQQFGGDSIYFPRGRTEVDERAAEVHAMWQAGAAIDEIAERYSYTPRWVYSLLGRERARLRNIRRTVESAHPSLHSPKPALPEAHTRTQPINLRQPQEGNQK